MLRPQRREQAFHVLARGAGVFEERIVLSHRALKKSNAKRATGRDLPDVHFCWYCTVYTRSLENAIKYAPQIRLFRGMGGSGG